MVIPCTNIIGRPSIKNSLTLSESLRTLVMRPPVCLFVKKLRDSLLMESNTSVLMSLTAELATFAITNICSQLVTAAISLAPIITKTRIRRASVYFPPNPNPKRYTSSFSSTWSKSTLPIRYGHAILTTAVRVYVRQSTTISSLYLRKYLRVLPKMERLFFFLELLSSSSSSSAS